MAAILMLLAWALSTAAVENEGNRDLPPIILNETDDTGTFPPFIQNETDENGALLSIIKNEEKSSRDKRDDEAAEERARIMMEEKLRDMRLARGEFEYTNPDILENGEPLFEKDIRLTPEQWAALHSRKWINYTSSLWPDVNGWPTVPYVFQDTNVNKTAVMNGINHWMNKTCIKFIETTNTNQQHLQFFQGSGCWSYLGMISSNGQQISIGAGCTGVGTVAHEIFHALGAYHEQSRLDRDNYVAILTDNIVTGKEHNFLKKNDNNLSVPYDYASAMHYGSRFFSRNGELTISTLDPLQMELIGRRSGLTHRDILLANKMYGCIDKWLSDCSMTSDPCLNDGFWGKDCYCVCPPGTTGSNCQTETGGYYDSYRSSCSEIITTASTVTSPGYPQNYVAGIKCTKIIRAPQCKAPKLTFTAFRLYNRLSDGRCYYDGLEIRTTNKLNGTWYCGAEISNGQTFTSTTSELILYFETRSSFYTGWSANIAFVPIPGCSVITTTTTTAVATTSATSQATSTTPTLSPSPTLAPNTTMTTTAQPTTNVSVTTERPFPYSLGCGAMQYKDRIEWQIPTSGKKYKNNMNCSFKPEFSNSPAKLVVKILKFQVQKTKGCRADYVKFEAQGMSKRLCGKEKKRTIVLPSTDFVASFVSDSRITKRGFKITIKPSP